MPTRVLNPLRQALRAQDGDLASRLGRIRESADLTNSISLIRTFDVITWMTGKKQGLVADAETVGR